MNNPFTGSGVALVTPFKQDKSIDFDALRKLVRYQIDGGIVRYAEKFKDAGLWEGSLYVFDRRFKLDYSKDTKVLSTCHMCDTPTSEYHNCTNLTCRRRTLICLTCSAQADEVFCHECL